MVRYSILLGGLVLTWGLGDAAWAGKAAYPCPCPSPDVCVPNVGGFGFFPTTWRQWPGEKRLEVMNPRAVGLPVLPTPEGLEHLPTPETTREGPENGMEGELLPPGGAILPPQGPEPRQELPAEPMAPAEGGLPGLPVEPGLEVLPGLPEQSKPTEEPKTPASDKPGADARWESRERVTAATPFQTRKSEPRSTVVLLVDGKALDESRVEPASYHADAVVTADADSSSKEGVEAAAYAMVESAATAEAGSSAKNGAPPIALGGYCPVDLILNGRWTPGDLRYTVVHHGWIYRLSGAAQWRRFQANPDDFAPAYSGNDPVLLIDSQNTAPGQIKYCATYNGRLYMFSIPATQARFNKNPQRYVVGK